MSDFRDMISNLVESLMPDFPIQLGTVLSVDLVNDTCDIDPIDGPTHFDAKLKSIVDTDFESRIVVYPKVDSKVIYALINNDPNNVVVLSVSDFESMIIEIGSVFKMEVQQSGKMIVESDDVEFNGGTFGGLTKIVDLVAQINRVESAHNQLALEFNSHPGHDAGPVPPPSTSTIAPLTTVADLENDKITH